MHKLSLKARLTLWYTVFMIVISSVALIAVASFSRNMSDRNSRERITQMVDSLAMQLENRNNNFSKPPMNDFEEPKKPRLKFYEQGVHMVLLDENKNVIEGQIPFSITDDLSIDDGTVHRKKYDDNLYLVYDRLVHLPESEKTAYLKGFIDIDENKYALISGLKNNLILTGILILLAAIGGYFITGRALSPVSKMSQTAKFIIDSKDLSQRINIRRCDDEIGELAHTLDEMLDEIQITFEREQQFTSDASHELRTPIAVIFSECEYMTDCAETVEELKTSAVSIKEETQRMSRLVSELLTISRMDKDTLKLNFETTNLSDLVNFVCSEQEDINDKSIILERNIEQDIIAEADKFLIARLFINIISNAYRYNKENGKITVSLYEDNQNIFFSVNDTGIGISEKDMPKIWERFYQAEPSRTANANGSAGLGLSMVKWIAKQHGGEVTVQSKLGEGSVFTFVMPKQRSSTEK